MHRASLSNRADRRHLALQLSLNLALHKIAPAIAAGNTIVLKPPSRDPLTMLLFAEIVESAGVPKGTVSIMPMNREVGDALVEDPRFKVLSFTGSPDVGWDLKRRAGMKKVILELGGNAGVIIDSDSDLDFAVNRIKVGAFAYSGQVCISVQRVFVVEDVYDEFRDKLTAAVSAIKLGDPLDRTTDLGPMIDAKAVQRTKSWIEMAKEEGARVIAGGSSDGAFLQPTVIENADPSSFVCSKEAFAPIVTIAPVKSFGEAIRKINDSEYGCRPVYSLIHLKKRSSPSRTLTSVASSSTTYRPTASTICRTAALKPLVLGARA